MPKYKPIRGFPNLKKPSVLDNVDKVNKRVRKILLELNSKKTK
jgi:hypothetical protein